MLPSRFSMRPHPCQAAAWWESAAVDASNSLRAAFTLLRLLSRCAHAAHMKAFRPSAIATPYVTTNSYVVATPYDDTTPLLLIDISIVQILDMCQNKRCRKQLDLWKLLEIQSPICSTMQLSEHVVRRQAYHSQTRFLTSKACIYSIQHQIPLVCAASVCLPLKPCPCCNKTTLVARSTAPVRRVPSS